MKFNESKSVTATVSFYFEAIRLKNPSLAPKTLTQLLFSGPTRLESSAADYVVGGVFFSAMQGGAAYYNWAAANNLLNKNPKKDIDADGISQYDEFVAGTNPYEPPLFGYQSWATLHGIVGAPDQDDDSDGIDNFDEYVLNGTAPNLLRLGSELEYSYLKRNDDSNLKYVLETRTNLTSGTWSSNGLVAVTNQIQGSDGSTGIAPRVPSTPPDMRFSASGG